MLQVKYTLWTCFLSEINVMHLYVIQYAVQLKYAGEEVGNTFRAGASHVLLTWHV